MAGPESQPDPEGDGHRLSPALRGALWMIGGVCCWTAIPVFVRFAASDIHPLQIAFLRTVFGVALVMPWVAARGTLLLPLSHVRLHFSRALFTAGAVVTSFWAFALMPLAEATAIQFTLPLFATVGAALFLSERVGVRRLAAVIVGLAGALMVIRPGPAGITPGAALALASALFGVGDWLLLKPLSRAVETPVVVAWLTLILVAVTAGPAAWVWTTPTWPSGLWVLALAVAATGGQVAATRALALADLSFVASLVYLQVVFVAAVAWAVFGEPVAGWTVAGAVVIVGAAIYVTRGESRHGPGGPQDRR